jgi:hypothetical protein
MANKYVNNSTYYTMNVMVKITEKQRLMLSLMTDILGENRSQIVRRLLMVEAKKVAAQLDGEELELWVDLINQIDKEEDFHEFEVGEAISQGMKEAYFERTGKALGYDDETTMKTNADKQRVWQRNYRAKQKFNKIKELEKLYED